MKARPLNLLIGAFLVLAGIAFLLDSLGTISLDTEYVFALLFLGAGVVLLAAHFFFRYRAWAAIVGGICLFIGAAIAIDHSMILPEDAVGIVLFSIVGLIFLSSLRHGKKNWWAVIPGVFCLILAAEVALDIIGWRAEQYQGVVFLAGLGLMFGIVYFLKDKTHNLGWAKYPSLVFWILAVLAWAGSDISDPVERFLLPTLLMGFGGWLIVRSLKKKSS